MVPETRRLGMGQMLVEFGDMRANLDRARAMMRRAATAGCRVLVLPECLDLGWTFPDAPHPAEPIPGRASDAICAGAIETPACGGRTHRARRPAAFQRGDSRKVRTGMPPRS